jgi:hypothetical protein
MASSVVTSGGFPFVGIQESDISKTVRVSPMRNLGIVEPIRLAGTNFEGNADAAFWTPTLVNTGTVTQAGGMVTLSTNSAVNGGAQNQTVRNARYVAGSSNFFRAVVRCPDGAGTANNTKRWGAFTCNGSPAVTPLNGAYFEVSGTTFNIVTVKNGVPAAVPAASFNVQGFTLDANAHTYEIWWTNSKVYFFVDDQCRHIMSASTATWSDTLTLQGTLQCLNSGSSATLVTLEVRVASIYRHGHLETEAAWKNIHGTVASTVCKLSAGRLHHVVVNSPGSGNADTVTLYDSPVVGSNIIGIISPISANGKTMTTLTYDLPFFNGLSVATSGSDWDVTVVYE